MEIVILAVAGLCAGILAGFLGIGGGTILVPILVTLGYTPIHAVATSNLSIVITSISGSIQNWRMGKFDRRKVLGLGLPAIVTAQIGISIASILPDYGLLIGFGLLLLSNIYLVDLRQKLTKQTETGRSQGSDRSILYRIVTGGAAGVLAGLFGVGGGVIMVPLQMLFLKENIKTAIQTSLGAVTITAISATVGHALKGNISWSSGTILGLGGLLGAQISTRLLPKLPDRRVLLLFRLFLIAMSAYVFYQSWQNLRIYFENIKVSNTLDLLQK
jgi:uncharacterized protein